MSFFTDLLDLFFPNLCCGCGKGLVKNEELICFRCRSELPKADFSEPFNNELKDRFVGKLAIEYALAGLFYYKSGITQKILSEFKYQNRPEIGELFGKQLGAMLEDHHVTNNIDYVVPVPLHPKKERKRGYNQSHFIANGISEITGIPSHFSLLKRVKHTESQTAKTREMRWKSVEDAFEVINPIALKSKHILLVDDVITTGSTIEACGKLLFGAGIDKISVATLAIAK